MKKCPFCGEMPLGNEIEPHTHNLVLNGQKMPDYPGGYATECVCGAGFLAENKEAAGALWNRRTADADLAAAQQEIARLRAALESARSYGSEAWSTWLISEVDNALDTK